MGWRRRSPVSPSPFLALKEIIHDGGLILKPFNSSTESPALSSRVLPAPAERPASLPPLPVGGQLSKASGCAQLASPGGENAASQGRSGLFLPRNSIFTQSNLKSHASGGVCSYNLVPLFCSSCNDSTKPPTLSGGQTKPA